MNCWSFSSLLGLELQLASMVLLDVISDVLLLLWKNSDVLCGVECEQLHLVQLQVMLTWSTAWCCWQLWCCQHKLCMQ
jgi:hypothetical protein